MIKSSSTDNKHFSNAEQEEAQSSVNDQRVLLICHSPELRIFIQKGLSIGDFEFFTVSDLSEAIDILASKMGKEAAFKAILLEIPDPLSEKAAEELGNFCEKYVEVPVVGIAPKASGDLVRESMTRGVRDFLTNPFNRSGISQTVMAVIKKHSQGKDTEATPSTSPTLEKQIEEESGKKNSGDMGTDVSDKISEVFITKNEKMTRILEILDRVAPTDSTVLIEGESGTGKELIARRIHNYSNRSKGPFVEVHCGAIPPNLLESQLFGHEKGSFTGAFSRQIGLFEIAEKGTIFLDEIAEMHLEMQVKLLRVLQERTIRRIGARQNTQVDVRVVAATNRELKAEVENNRFRPDLYYRLNVISLIIPPLCERLEDIPDLIEFFINRFHKEKGLPKKRFHEETLVKLQKMRWVGNVREIENAVERLILLSPNEEVLPQDVDEHVEGGQPSSESPFSPTLTLDEVKKIHLTNVLDANEGNKMRTARVLGINVKTLYNLIQKLDIPT